MEIATKKCQRCKEDKTIVLNYSMKSPVCKECVSKDNKIQKAKFKIGMPVPKPKRFAPRKSCTEI